MQKMKADVTRNATAMQHQIHLNVNTVEHIQGIKYASTVRLKENHSRHIYLGNAALSIA